MSNTYRLAPAFWDDHIGRDLDVGVSTERSRGKYCVYVTLDNEAYDELLSDARHYADPDSGLREEVPHLVDSAKRVVKVLTKQGPPRLEDSVYSADQTVYRGVTSWCQKHAGEEPEHDRCFHTDERLGGKMVRVCVCKCHDDDRRAN